MNGPHLQELLTFQENLNSPPIISVQPSVFCVVLYRSLLSFRFWAFGYVLWSMDSHGYPLVSSIFFLLKPKW